MEHTNLAATYVKMFHYNKINVSEEIDGNKSNKWRECMIRQYWYFLNGNYKYKPEVCNGCHDISMMTFESEDIAILNVKRCWLWMCYMEYH